MDRVSSLVKLAQEVKEKKNEAAKGAALVAGGSAAVGASKSRLLGYHNVLHGTSKSNAASVKRDGALKPSKGGSKGGATESLKNESLKDTYRPRVKGKVHVTKSPIHARMFASGAEKGFGGVTGGKVLKGKMSHNQWRQAKRDPDVVGKDGPKSVAATTKHRVKTDNSQKFATKKNMKRYLKSTSGKKRFARGVGMAATGTAAAAAGTKKIVDAVRSRKKDS